MTAKKPKIVGKKTLADRAARNKLRASREIPAPPEFGKALESPLPADRDLRPPATDHETKPLKFDIMPPGGPDAAAAESLARPVKLKGSEKPKIDAGQFEFDAKDLEAMLQVWNLIIGSRSQKWILTDPEIAALVKTIPPVLKKWFPDMAQWLPETALASALLGIIFARLNMTAFLPDVVLPPPAPIPDPERKPEPPVLDLDNLIKEAENNASRDKQN